MVSRGEQPKIQLSGDLPDNEAHAQTAHRDEVDWHLADLLQWMEAFHFSLDLTLWVDGFMITGRPISSADFWKRTGEKVAQSWEAQQCATSNEGESASWRKLSEALGELFRTRGAAYEIPETDSDEELAEIQERILNTPREHIILSDVVIFSPDGQEMHVDLWRGRLDHVAGWIVGRVSHA